jgi:hypothetical protein
VTAQRLLDQRHAEALRLRRADVANAALAPFDDKAPRPAALQPPAHRELAAVARQSAVFPGVRRQLVDDKRELNRGLGIEEH